MIHGLTVCVGYAPWLAVALPRWREGCASVTVVTTPEDVQTQALLDPGVQVYTTESFYADGAVFNKGRALEEARVRAVPREGWLLLFDADIVPPAGWQVALAEAQRAGVVRSGFLHGCRRFDASPDDPVDRGQPPCRFDVPGVGFFQLFDQADPIAQTVPLIDTHWTHAGNYDNVLMNRWRTKGLPVRELPFRVAHIGERENWFGRGNRAAFDAMQTERTRRGGRWDHERIEVRP